MIVQSSVLLKVPGVFHGFGTREEPVPSEILPLWNERKPQWKQVHGVAFAEVSRPNEDCGEVDALHTSEPGQPIAVVTADCVPILMARKDGARVAAIHAGWRGTKGRILRMLWSGLEKGGEKAQDWVAAIGPSIGPCCYEVSEELAADFEKEFAGHGESLAVPRHRILDLPAINAAELRAIGFSKVDLIRACTRCNGAPDAPTFHSYRREGGGTRQYSLIVRR